ncbi:MAG TPA: hypothetical protein VIH15_14270, partial [Casimicrobiaceae bacterium]
MRADAGVPALACEAGVVAQIQRRLSRRPRRSSPRVACNKLCHGVLAPVILHAADPGFEGCMHGGQVAPRCAQVRPTTHSRRRLNQLAAGLALSGLPSKN